MKALVAGAAMLLLTGVASGAQTLEIFVVDTEGGKAMILRTPDGHTMLVDAGYPTKDERDTERIVHAAQDSGIKSFDYIVATHYDLDHSGNVAQLDARIPGKVFVDHGEPIATLNAKSRAQNYEPYVRAIGNRKRMSVKPGDVIQLGALKITVVAAGGKAISSPLPGAGQPNPLTLDSRPTYRDRDDNAGSVGLVYEFGKFRMLDLADLLSSVEYDLVCPRNRIGTVDVFMVSHHGLNVSNARFLVHAVRPKVAIMNNGTTKGGAPETLEILTSSPGFQDLWQLHNSRAAGERNAPADFIANPTDPCEAKLIKLTVQPDGQFTVTNTRNGFSKTYRP